MRRLLLLLLAIRALSQEETWAQAKVRTGAGVLAVVLVAMAGAARERK